MSIPTMSITSQAHRLPEGQSTTFTSPSDGSLRIETKAGQPTLKIRWEQGQAIVELQDAQLQISSPGQVSFHCETFSVQADQDINLQSQGNWHANAVQQMKLSAHSLSLRATLGDILLRANDFVRAFGEKILLNTDTCPEQARRQTQSYLARLLGHQPPHDAPTRGPE